MQRRCVPLLPFGKARHLLQCSCFRRPCQEQYTLLPIRQRRNGRPPKSANDGPPQTIRAGWPVFTKIVPKTTSHFQTSAERKLRISSETAILFAGPRPSRKLLRQATNARVFAPVASGAATTWRPAGRSTVAFTRKPGPQRPYRAPCAIMSQLLRV